MSINWGINLGSFGAVNPFGASASSYMMNYNMCAFNPFFNFNFSPVAMPVFSMPTFQMPTFNFTLPTFNFTSAPSEGSSSGDTFTRTGSGVTGTKSSIVSKAQSYSWVKSDYDGNRLFSPKNPDGSVKTNWGWCCDFTVSVYKQVMGSKFPSSLNTSSPIVLKDNADKLGCYHKFPSSSRAEWAQQNIKPGDILIMSGKGPSKHHVAIVKSVHDGKIETISGNSGNAVKSVTYNASSASMYGVINLDKYMA